MKSFIAVAVLFALALAQNDRALSAAADPWKALAFLEGTWDAHAQAGSAGAQSNNEGHVIHYAVSSPDSNTAMFISEVSPSGPQFRLVYELKVAVMWGKFQMRMPGQAEWKSYLEWSGAKK